MRSGPAPCGRELGPDLQTRDSVASLVTCRNRLTPTHNPSGREFEPHSEPYICSSEACIETFTLKFEDQDTRPTSPGCIGSAPVHQSQDSSASLMHCRPGLVAPRDPRCAPPGRDRSPRPIRMWPGSRPSTCRQSPRRIPGSGRCFRRGWLSGTARKMCAVTGVWSFSSIHGRSAWRRDQQTPGALSEQRSPARRR